MNKKLLAAATTALALAAGAAEPAFRPVILNNDGCEFTYAAKPYNRQNLLSYRSSPLIGTDVGIISFCPIAAGFGHFAFDTASGDDFYDHPVFGTYLREMREQQTSPIAEVRRFARESGFVFWASIRMNDARHDAVWRPGYRYADTPTAALFSKFKEQHPEWLCGDYRQVPPHGYWSAVDYGHAEVRARCLEHVREFFARFEPDGIELDFGRDPILFKSVCEGGVATPEQLDAVTAMIREIRQIADAAAKRQGRPITVAVRAPDSFGFGRAVGLDLERWMREKLIDLFIGGDEVHLTPWSKSAAACRRYGVRFHANMTDAYITAPQHPLLKRNRSTLAFRAQAAAAWAEGVDGLYVYNEYSPGAPDARYLKEIGDAAKLRGLNKFYYFTYSHFNLNRFLKNGERFRQLPTLSPVTPAVVPDAGLALPLYLGDEPSGGEARLFLQLDGSPPDGVAVTVNGTPLPTGAAFRGLAAFAVAPELLRTGRNLVKIAPLTPGDDVEALILAGDARLTAGRNQGRWRRLFRGHDPAGEAAGEDGYLLRDATAAGMTNLVHPLPGENDFTLDFEVRRLDGDEPDAVVLRFAAGPYCEYLRFEPDQVSLKYAKAARPWRTETMQAYRLNVKGGHLTLSSGNETLLSVRLPKRTAPPDADFLARHLEHHSDFSLDQSLIIGSLSPAGAGAARWRNLKLRTGAVRLIDGALLIVHDRDEELVQPYFPVQTLAARTAELTAFAAVSYRADSGRPPQPPWRAANFSQANTAVADGVLRLDHRTNGPIIRLAAPDEPFALGEISGKVRLTENTEKAQLQISAMFDAPSGGSVLWGFRFRRGAVSFLDDPPISAAKAFEQPTRFRLLIDPRRNRGELYLDESAEPILVHAALAVKQRGAGIQWGDGSAAVEGAAEIEEITVQYWQ